MACILHRLRLAMRKGLFIISFCIITLVGYGQQSLFNVPSIDATEYKKFFFQQQINFTPKNLAFNTNMAFGLGKGFEAGLNITDANFNWQYDGLSNWQHFRSTPSYTLLMLTATKVFQVSQRFKIGIGTQLGFNPLLRHNAIAKNLATWNFVNTGYTFIKSRISVYGGVYYGNRTFLIDKAQPGVLLGFECPLYKEKLDLMADWIIGTHEEAVSVIGLVYKATPHVALSLGAQLPSPGTENPFGGVFELTIN